MIVPKDDPRFLKGIEEFNQQLFFESHETLEEIWLEDHGPDRLFYQGIIQIAAGYFKLEQKVPAGALKLWRTGLAKSQPHGPADLRGDEPTVKLESQTGRSILCLLRTINEENGSTIVMVTHSDEAARTADRTIHLRDGHLVD